MNDFTKQKIAFAIGLLAVLFTVTPLVQAFGDSGYYVFGAKLTVLRLYYALSVTLMLSTYFYALQFLSERDLRYPAIIGNLLYAVALVMPLFSVCLFLITLAVGFLRLMLTNHSVQAAISVVSGVISALIGVLSLDVVRRLGQALGIREKKAVSQQLEREEMQFFRRAEELLEGSHYDLAVVEAWKAIEVAARRSLLGRRGPEKFRLPLYREIEMYELLPKSLIPVLHEVRRIRNLGAHAVEPISEEQARSAIELSARILAALAPEENDSEEPE